MYYSIAALIPSREEGSGQNIKMLENMRVCVCVCVCAHVRAPALHGTHIDFQQEGKEPEKRSFLWLLPL